MCINHSKLSGENPSGQAYQGEERQDRKKESPVSLVLIQYQFKFETVYSISIIQLSKFPRDRLGIVFTGKLAFIGERYSDWTGPTVKLNYTLSDVDARVTGKTREGQYCM